MKKLKFKFAFLIIAIIVVGFIVVNSANAELETVDATTYRNAGDGIISVENYGGGGIQLNIDNLPAGKRIDDILYCSSNCDQEENWYSAEEYDNQNNINGYINSVGNTDMTIDVKLPNDNEMLYIKAKYVDLEPMDISYAKFLPSTTNEKNYNEVYNDQSKDLSNYENSFTPIATGYKGGDIILPEGCTENGCLLKVTLTTSDFNKYKNRFETDNEHADEEEMVDLSSMFNHLQTVNSDSGLIYRDNNDKVYYETEGDNTSFYIIVNKFMSETNAFNFTFCEGKNRVLTEDYIGLDYKLPNNRKYFDEKNNFADLTFTEFNNYTSSEEIFYGVPRVNFKVDSQIAAVATDASGMGTLKNVYNKIESADQQKYPVNDGVLTIKSFYEPDYDVKLVLKNGSDVVKNITVRFNRFAFGGNAGGLLVVDDQGRNCRSEQDNPNCTPDNLYVSTDYRGLVDTFYTDLNIDPFDALTFSKVFFGEHASGLADNTRLYTRNEDFNPWAVAVYYSGDTVVATRSFNLGEIVKTGGYNKTAIPEEEVNNVLAEADNPGAKITDYDSSLYTIFGYGNGFELPIKDIMYFDERTFNDGVIEQRLILASKQEIEENEITKIALFLTNGELKSDDQNFPELTYGVGEGKIFEVDHRTFEGYGGN